MDANLNEELNILVLKGEVPSDICKKIIDVVKDWKEGTVETPARLKENTILEKVRFSGRMTNGFLIISGNIWMSITKSLD